MMQDPESKMVEESKPACVAPEAIFQSGASESGHTMQGSRCQAPIYDDPCSRDYENGLRISGKPHLKVVRCSRREPFDL